MMTDKDIEDFERQIQEMKDNPGRKGPNDLEQRIEDLTAINESHRKLNGELRQRIDFYKIQVDQLKKENNKLRSMGNDFLDEHRSKGDL
jgi:polyhydroxyalkanoate synthesis regulator phasin